MECQLVLPFLGSVLDRMRGCWIIWDRAGGLSLVAATALFCATRRLRSDACYDGRIARESDSMLPNCCTVLVHLVVLRVAWCCDRENCCGNTTAVCSSMLSPTPCALSRSLSPLSDFQPTLFSLLTYSSFFNQSARKTAKS